MDVISECVKLVKYCDVFAVKRIRPYKLDSFIHECYSYLYSLGEHNKNFNDFKFYKYLSSVRETANKNGFSNEDFEFFLKFVCKILRKYINSSDESVDKRGFMSDGININTGTKYDVQGYDYLGFNVDGIHKGTGKKYDRDGFNRVGIHKDTGTLYNVEGYDRDGYDREGNKVKEGIHIHPGFSSGYLSGGGMNG